MKWLFAVIGILFCSHVCYSQSRPLNIWFDKPARQWEETLPLGNGRLGMTPDGGVQHEKIVLNDITLWSGGVQDANNYNAYKQLPAIRNLLAAGKNDAAQKLIDQNFVCLGPGSGGKQWGCFQLLANLAIDYSFPDPVAAPNNYRRRLSLDSAIAYTTFTAGDVHYKRTYYTSYANDVMIIKLEADKKKALRFAISISRPEKGATTSDANQLLLKGQLDNGTDGKGMQYAAAVRVQTTDGHYSIDKDHITVSDASEAIIYISAATDFRQPAYITTLQKNMSAAMRTPYTQEVQQHVFNYRKLFSRVSLQLSRTTINNHLPTDQRLAAYYAHPELDPELATLFFQFGRYLTISSTRVGLLPPNLQGLWANQIQTPWNGDYHLDVNVQMNHWPVEPANLSELNLPLAELVQGLVKPGQRTAKAYYNARGWVAHVITNIWGFTEPGESASWGITKAGSGWLCNNLWEHYAFTNDRKYLETIYPILKGSALFYKDILVKDEKTGWLVTSPSSSPENTFYLPNGNTASICVGATIDNQVIRELFTNVITASHLLHQDAAFADSLQTCLSFLPPAARIAPDGRIMEWLENYRETDTLHRHISHLYALYPGNLITPDKTPQLAVAAKKTLDMRGDDGPSWSIAYKQLFWARLQDGNRAFKLFRELLKPTLRTDINYGAGGGVYPNLLSAGPPFQIDGNFGATAAIAEMLLQSHDDFIALLPAIPDQWKGYGKVTGLKARGNIIVSMEWENGVVTQYKIQSATARQIKVKINGVVKNIATTSFVK
ncbi:MAG: glycoside hydrolase family 95 protein [Filimonas sp.]|nr:glycoside hydrolase family 95 protein [Filimonas sp.]